MTRHKPTEALNSERIFTSLALFGIFGRSFLAFLQAFAEFMSCLGSTDHIRNFLSQTPRQDFRDLSISPPLLESPSDDKLYTKIPAVEAIGVSVWWNLEQPPVLHDLSFTIQRSTVTMVVGPVGCGKSALLRTLLSEVPHITGKLRVGSRRIAYCSQTPWLANESIKRNIVGAAEYVENWYLTVVEACGLQEDFTQLRHGDHTMVGSKGLSLSGGQKQRLVSLLRVLLSRLSGLPILLR